MRSGSCQTSFLNIKMEYDPCFQRVAIHKSLLTDAGTANCLLLRMIASRFQQILKISVQISYYSKILWSTHFYKYSELLYYIKW